MTSNTFISTSKDVLYLIGSVLGIVGFVRTFKKRDNSGFNYRTDFGNEVEPFLVCLRGNIYNLEVSNKDRSVMVQKYSSDIIPNYDVIKNSKSVPERSAFYTIIKEGEFLKVENHDLKMKDIYLRYEDSFQNHYYQKFSFDQKEIGNTDRIKRTNRSCYKLTKRKYRVCYIWFPLLIKY